MTTPTLYAYRHGNRYVAARIRLDSSAGAIQEDKPLHLAILLDTSGSMEGERMIAVKRTLRAARDLFQPADRVTLVCFDDVATTVASGLRMDDAGKEQFYARVERITTQGCTNLSAGIEALLAEQSASRPYTALVILTDGHINRGVSSNAGLQSMITGLGGSLPVTALGYGAEHNRTLLRDIALRSRGAYTFVDSDETLPVVMGDLIGGQRSVACRRVAVSIAGQPNWVSAELDGDGARHMVGDIVPDRDYWVVFENPDEPTHGALELALTAEPVLPHLVHANVEESDNPAVQEQVFRCRVAAVSAAVTNALERSAPVEEAYQNRLVSLQNEMSAEALTSPLILRLRAQVAELLEAIAAASAPHVWGPASSALGLQGPASPTWAASPGGFGAGTPTAVLARLASNTAQLSLQRGVASASVEPDAGDPVAVAPATMFSSPVQLRASTTCRTNYRGSPPPAS